jgi:hypothetical protein
MREGAVVILRDGRDFTPLDVRERVCAYGRHREGEKEGERESETERQRERCLMCVCVCVCVCIIHDQFVCTCVYVVEPLQTTE